jgi:hypothetical protein
MMRGRAPTRLSAIPQWPVAESPFGYRPMGQKFFISFNSADQTKAHWIA